MALLCICTRSTVAGAHKHTRGQGYLYTSLRATQVTIHTEAAGSMNLSTATSGFSHLSNHSVRLPYLAMERSFTAKAIVIHDCVVRVGKHQFLISAHHSVDGPVNGALKELAPGFDWRGELIIVALGRYVPYLKRMKRQPATAAINKFLATSLAQIHLNLPIPLSIM
ncbi:hypothetical protein B0H17DRAFT_1153818 [Mycena rosella]|uniref:Uncharacterized protein n=1 Tax=Mycena rosella TaxID=1033263 RepID=A0AAD7B377_MYCRO|nr:hypothetical protein B0H17DRAFT_1153818 [Mycena rosella]